MGTVTIRYLRSHAGEVVDRVEAGESVVISRSGKPVAELRPIRRRGLDATTLLAQWSRVPHVDPVAFRRDLDDVVDAAL